MSNNTTLQHTDSAKLLGIYIQRNLKQHSTVSNIVKKLQPVIQMLRYATTLLPTQYICREKEPCRERDDDDDDDFIRENFLRV